MAKFKPAKGKKKGRAAGMSGAIPCIVIILLVIALISLLFFLALRSGT